LADKVIKGITCPSCGGEQELREGVKTFNCKYCGTLLVTSGVDGAIKYYVPNKLQRNIAIQNAYNWLGKGFSKARGLKAGSKIDDAFLVYIPYWRVRADVIGWVFGKERKTRTVNNTVETYYVDVEKKILKTYDRTYPACDIAELGVRQVQLTGDTMLPVNFDELQTEGMLFNIVSSEKDVSQQAETDFIQEAVNSASVDRITFEHHDLVRPDVNAVYYPMWVVRYEFQNRTYQVVVAGDDGSICYGKAPGNNLYRAVVGIFGAALGTFLITFFGIFGIVGGNGSAKAALIIYIFCLIFGIGAIRWAYKKFRYGGEVEEGTGIVKEQKAKSTKKSTSTLGNIAKGVAAGSVLDIASDILSDR
jgi:hypothetical protein